MASFIGSVVLTTSDGPRASAFWRGALGYVPHPHNPDFLVPHEWQPPSNTRHDHADGVHLHLDESDRMHLDLWVDRDGGSTLESEVERLLALGATRVEWEYTEGQRHVVLADPDGNHFCVCD